ncbi:hypothetical protein ACFQZ1_08020 [Bacillus sp. CGMCC 1.60114]|uniref:hypothetical protein n=1 Tax=unclassified Bacillus (in: firmicutes) TaxID=185979 RepID=UPI003634AFC0
MFIQMDSILFEHVELYSDGCSIGEGQPTNVGIKYTLHKKSNVLSGVLNLKFDEYKELTHNELLDRIKECVTFTWG